MFVSEKKGQIEDSKQSLGPLIEQSSGAQLLQNAMGHERGRALDRHTGNENQRLTDPSHDDYRETSSSYCRGYNQARFLLLRFSGSDTLIMERFVKSSSIRNAYRCAPPACLTPLDPYPTDASPTALTHDDRSECVYLAQNH